MPREVETQASLASSTCCGRAPSLTLSYNGSTPLRRLPMQALPPAPRRQLTLAFPDTPAPTEAIWETLDPATKKAALQALARILAQAVLPPREQEHSDD